MQPGAVAVAEEMKAPGRSSSMKEKSSAPITGATSVSTLSAPAIPRAIEAANAVCASWFTTTG